MVEKVIVRMAVITLEFILKQTFIYTGLWTVLGIFIAVVSLRFHMNGSSLAIRASYLEKIVLGLQ